MAKQQAQKSRYLTLDGRATEIDGQPDDGFGTDILNPGIVCPVLFGAANSFFNPDSLVSLFTMALGIKIHAKTQTLQDKKLTELFGMAARNEVLIDTRPEEITAFHKKHKESILAIRRFHGRHAALELGILPLCVAALIKTETGNPATLSPYFLSSSMLLGEAINNVRGFGNYSKLARDEWVLIKRPPPQAQEERAEKSVNSAIPEPAA